MKKVKDHYFNKAKQEGYRARSVYKLQEADNKYRFLKRGCNVLDLGASPGSWSRYASGKVGKDGHVVAVDIRKTDIPGPNVQVIAGDISNIEPADLQAMVPAINFDVVLSDMAPSTTGNRGVDHMRSIGLAEIALRFAESLLKPGAGAFYCKVFEGSDMNDFCKKCRSVFRSVRIFKPRSSRAESVEIFLFCMELV